MGLKGEQYKDLGELKKIYNGLVRPYPNRIEDIFKDTFACLKFTKVYRATLYCRLEKYFSNEKKFGSK